MNIQLNELEAKIQQLFDDGELRDSRAVFDIGVQFGTLLQSEKIENYDFVFWKKRNEESEAQREIYKAIDSINKFLITLVQKSIKEYIEENGSWNISKGNWSSEYDEFSRKTIRKYCVQITSVDMTQYGGDFECKFKVVGKLAKLFKSHNVFNQFEVSITNDSGEEYTSIRNTERCDRRVSTVHCYVRNVNNWSADEYKNFLQVISKDFLFEIIKDS